MTTQWSRLPEMEKEVQVHYPLVEGCEPAECAFIIVFPGDSAFLFQMGGKGGFNIEAQGELVKCKRAYDDIGKALEKVAACAQRDAEQGLKSHSDETVKALRSLESVKHYYS